MEGRYCTSNINIKKYHRMVLYVEGVPSPQVPKRGLLQLWRVMHQDDIKACHACEPFEQAKTEYCS